jgi:hypothetical protein
MKILKKIIAIVLISIVAVSCSKDEEGVIETQTRKNLLLKTTDSDDELISTYTYDSTNRLTNYKLNGNANNAARNHNFTYNADGTLDQITEASGGALIMKYFYSTNKKVVKKEGRNGLDVYLYSYSGSTIIESYRFTPDNTGFRNIYTYDANGDIIKEEYYTHASNANPLGTYAATVNKTFDNKKNANESLPAEYLFPTSAHNQKSYQANSGSVATSSYNYNADNYPVKRTDSFTRTYEYKRL